MTPLIVGPLPSAFRRYQELPDCPRCGDSLLVAEASELVNRGHVRHTWLCDSCGHDFVTVVQVSTLADSDTD